MKEKPLAGQGTDMPVEFLYHVTRRANLAAILEHGLQTRFYGAVHGSCDIHPPRPAVYLSRKPLSDNLHCSLFDGSPLVVLRIDASRLESSQMWPDDFVYGPVSEGDMLESTSAVARALGISRRQAREVFDRIEEASEEDMPEVLQPFWRWYLTLEEGGEVAYTADVPPGAILAAAPYEALDCTGPEVDAGHAPRP
jgi:hypothetical protein